MKKITLKVCTILTASLFTLGMQAQNEPKNFGKKPLQALQCATPEYEAMLLNNNKDRHTKDQFEQWMSKKLAARKQMRSGMGTQDVNEIITVPIVVHVIHNGGPVGVAENIADEQILSQITVLNQDYRRQAGTNGFNTNPVGADVEVEFCLAQRDPNGLATNGIDRITMFNDATLGWDMGAVEVVKTQTQWDPEKYLNIWVFNYITLQAAYEIYGYSQFPTDSGLDGLVDPSMATTANTDGIMVEAKCFGSVDIYPQGMYMAGRNKGRTISHEVGHYLGLRHIWGDGNNCTSDDYCADTPIAFTANQGPCPGVGYDSCPNSLGVDMFENYMDYTNDVCLNVFTQDQKERIRTVLENAPRRVTLATANSCSLGTVYDNDGSLRMQSFNVACNSPEATPEIMFRNSGNNAITTATISYHIDNQTPTLINWEGNLAAGESTVITTPQITGTGGGHTFSYAIVTINGAADATPLNDAKTEAFTISSFTTPQVIVTIKTDNNASETRWLIVDENQDIVYSYTGGTYLNNQVYTTPVNIPETGCYTFAIIDNGNNGICCANGEGYYEVKTSDGTLIVSGAEFTLLQLFSMGITSTLSTNNPVATSNTIKLYPNPSNSVVNLDIPQSSTLPDGYTIYNNLGQVIDTGKVNSNTPSFNISGYANGVYFIKLNGGNANQTLQFIKY